jgi:phage protein D
MSPGKRFTDVSLIGASYVMKQANQRIFKNITADAVIKQIASSHGFYSDVDSHPRVYPQIAQAGHTDLEMMVRLAKQSGYSLRIKDTTVHFKPQDFDYTGMRGSAQKFIMRDPNHPQGSTLYSFDLLVGESIYYKDSMKAAVAVSGVDAQSATLVKITSQERNMAIRTNQASEIFDRYATEIVAPSFSIANHEAIAADARNRFPYRAKVEVTGNPELRPDMPIYLDGLGAQYSGYWIILSAEHRVIEQKLNQFKYTTVLEVGSDSLGTPGVWKDGTSQSSPNLNKPVYKAPAVVKKQSKNKTVLKHTSKHPKKQFSFTKNRAPLKTSAIEQEFPKWQHHLGGYEKPEEAKRSKIAAERLRNSSVL